MRNAPDLFDSARAARSLLCAMAAIQQCCRARWVKSRSKASDRKSDAIAANLILQHEIRFALLILAADGLLLTLIKSAAASATFLLSTVTHLRPHSRSAEAPASQSNGESPQLIPPASLFPMICGSNQTIILLSPCRPFGN